MARRTGANGRKKRLERAGKRRLGGRAALAIAMGLAIAIGGGTLLFRTGVMRAAPLIERLFCNRNSMVTNITVVGGGHVTAGQIIGRLGFQFPMRFLPMKRTFVKKWSRVNPWIAEAKLYGPQGGSVTVIITERKPVAIAARAAVWFIDTTGAYIPFDPRIAQHLPFVSGLRDSTGGDGRQYLTNEDRGRMNRLLHGLAAFDPKFVTRVTQLHFAPHGTVAMWLEGSPTAIELDGNNLEEGLERLVKLLPLVRSDSGIPSRIDLSCRDLAFVTIDGTTPESAGKALQKE